MGGSRSSVLKDFAVFMVKHPLNLYLNVVLIPSLRSGILFLCCFFTLAKDAWSRVSSYTNRFLSVIWTIPSGYLKEEEVTVSFNQFLSRHKIQTGKVRPDMIKLESIPILAIRIFSQTGAFHVRFLLTQMWSFGFLSDTKNRCHKVPLRETAWVKNKNNLSRLLTYSFSNSNGNWHHCSRHGRLQEWRHVLLRTKIQQQWLLVHCVLGIVIDTESCTLCYWLKNMLYLSIKHTKRVLLFSRCVLQKCSVSYISNVDNQQWFARKKEKKTQSNETKLQELVWQHETNAESTCLQRLMLSAFPSCPHMPVVFAFLLC